jgi:hypothetical protein
MSRMAIATLFTSRKRRTEDLTRRLGAEKSIGVLAQHRLRDCGPHQKGRPDRLRRLGCFSPIQTHMLFEDPDFDLVGNSCFASTPDTRESRDRFEPAAVLGQLSRAVRTTKNEGQVVQLGRELHHRGGPRKTLHHRKRTALTLVRASSPAANKSRALFRGGLSGSVSLKTPGLPARLRLASHLTAQRASAVALAQTAYPRMAQATYGAPWHCVRRPHSS